MGDWYYDTFAKLLLEIDNGAREFCRQRPRVAHLLWEMVDYHFGWPSDNAVGVGRKNLLARYLSGKRCRPLLALLVGRALTSSHKHVLPAAIGVELIHNFSIVHDDVMDKSAERRHRPSLWAKWGVGQAVNAGDGLYALGISALLDLLQEPVHPSRVAEVLAAVLDACIAMVQGQVLDVSFETRTDVRPDEYLAMVSSKSAALIECSARVGALLSTDDEAVVSAYARFGRNLGIAFQIWDDYLGVWGKEENMGKSATSDIEQRKKTYPILTAFQRAGAGQRRDLLAVYEKEKIQAADVDLVLEILANVEAAHYTKQIVETYYQRALDALESTGVENENQRLLRELAAFLVARSH